MKITAFILLAACLQLAARTSGQTVTIRVKNVPMKEVFREIQKQTGLDVLVDEGLLQKTGRVTLDVKDMPVSDVLNICLKNEPLNYLIHDGRIIIKSKASSVSIEPLQLPSPPIEVKGRVTDNDGNPVAGATVTVKGSVKATATNSNGEFELPDVDAEAILIFTSVGYDRQEVSVRNRTFITAQLRVAVGNLDELQIIAYGTTTKRLNTGSVSSVKSAEIEKQPVSNVLAAMQGRVPGLDITQQTGIPGGNFTVRIRGQNSIVNGNEPLYIIDGVPYESTSLSNRLLAGQLFATGESPLNSIDPLQIENIEILRDADATAIYGSRGANGVILITTKKGYQGKAKVDFNFTSGAGKPSSKMDLMNTRQYLDMRYEAFRNDNIDWRLPAVSAPDLKAWDTTRYTDWQKELLGETAHYMDAQMAFSGGDKNTQYSLGGGYHKETTVFPGDNAYERIATRFNLSNSSFNDKLKIYASANYTATKTTLPVIDLTSTALIQPPDAPPLFTPDGNLNWGPNVWNGVGNTANPLMYTKCFYESKTNMVIGNAVLSYSILPNLVIKANLGFTNTSVKSIRTTPLSALDPVVAAYSENQTWFATNNTTTWITEPQIDWKQKIGKGELGLLVGSSFLETVNEGDAIIAYGFSSEALMRSMNSANRIERNSTLYNQYRYSGFFGRINYTLNRKYVLNITGRYDGSSRFGPDKQFAGFGAVGGAWVFSEEKLIANNLSFLSFGKIRASYGTTGNDQIGDYQYLDTYSSTGSGSYIGITGLNPQRLYNPEFGWETVKKIEAAIELGFLKNRLTTSVSYYRNRSDNQLVGLTLPPTTGFYSIQSNFPATVQNTGVELVLNTVNVQNKNFTWSMSLNLTIPKNKLVDFPNLETSQYANYYAVGKPLDIRKRYRYLGVNSQTGMYEFEDVNKDNIYNQADRQLLIFVGKKFYGGLSNSFQYKMISLDFLFQFVKQTAANYISYTGTAPGRLAFNGPEFLQDRWQRPGDQTDIQKFGTLSSYQTSFERLVSSDHSVSDASYIRLKNIQLSFATPAAWLKKVHLQNARIFLQGQNLLTFTNYKGLDPETQNTVLPPLRMLTAGIHLTF